MPEVLTKYPTVVLQVLKGAGAKCGAQQPRLLKDCPVERLCALPTGELCVYDLTSIREMTQLTATELSNASYGSPPIFSALGAIIIIFALGIGLFIGSKMIGK